MGLLVIERTRAGETRQGHLRWFDEAIAQFLDWYLYYHFFRGFYGAQAVKRVQKHNECHDFSDFDCGQKTKPPEICQRHSKF